MFKTSQHSAVTGILERHIYIVVIFLLSRRMVMKSEAGSETGRRVFEGLRGKRGERIRKVKGEGSASRQKRARKELKKIMEKPHA